MNFDLFCADFLHFLDFFSTNVANFLDIVSKKTLWLGKIISSTWICRFEEILGSKTQKRVENMTILTQFSSQTGLWRHTHDMTALIFYFKNIHLMYFLPIISFSNEILVFRLSIRTLVLMVRKNKIVVPLRNSLWDGT